MLFAKDNSERMEKAHRLYMTGHFNQIEIAEMAGVTRRTLYNWIHQNNWQRAHQNAIVAPAIITENFIAALLEMQTFIKQRPEGNRFPTPSEMNTQFKLLTCITRLSSFPTKAIQNLSLSQFNNATTAENTMEEPAQTQNPGNHFAPNSQNETIKNKVEMGNISYDISEQNMDNQALTPNMQVEMHEKLREQFQTQNTIHELENLTAGLNREIPENQFAKAYYEGEIGEKYNAPLQQQEPSAYIDEDEEDDYVEDIVYECELPQAKGLSMEEKERAFIQWFKNRHLNSKASQELRNNTYTINRPLEAHEIDYLFIRGYTNQDIAKAFKSRKIA